MATCAPPVALRAAAEFAACVASAQGWLSGRLVAPATARLLGDCCGSTPTQDTQWLCSSGHAAAQSLATVVSAEALPGSQSYGGTAHQRWRGKGGGAVLIGGGTRGALSGAALPPNPHPRVAACGSTDPSTAAPSAAAIAAPLSMPPLRRNPPQQPLPLSTLTATGATLPGAAARAGHRRSVVDLALLALPPKRMSAAGTTAATGREPRSAGARWRWVAPSALPWVGTSSAYTSAYTPASAAHLPHCSATSAMLRYSSMAAAGRGLAFAPPEPQSQGQPHAATAAVGDQQQQQQQQQQSDAPQGTSAAAAAGGGAGAQEVWPAYPQRQSPPAVAALGFVSGGYDVGAFPPERIRNFSIIAHVDHGKSTLADRLMEMTGALGGKATHNAQYLDKLQVERERGITVKAQTVSLVYLHGGVPYLLNLIDTPGHVDFSYEVSRSLAACQGALLVVDAAQGIQAQTVANFYLAFEQGLDLVPVVNKIDLPSADPRGCVAQLAAAFDLDPGSVLLTSAKTGLGLEAVLPAVIERVRPPSGDPSARPRLLLFDAFHDEYRGVVVLVEVVDGAVAVGDKVAMASTGTTYEVQEVGLLAPERHATGRLLTGQVGYLVCGIKDLKAARVGDTLFAAHAAGTAPTAAPARLAGFKPAKAMVFAGLFPLGGDGQEFDGLAAAMDKLLLTDASVVVKRENSDALGPGFRCGFLGMLHMEIFTQRLEQEFGAAVVTTTPMVPYVLEMPDGGSITLESAAEFPLDKKISVIMEPTVTATLITPDASLGRLMELCTARRGEQLEHSSLGGGRTMLRYSLPLAELAGDFYSSVKSKSQGYASFDYEEGPYRPADLVRLDILAHGTPVDALARMVSREEAGTIGRALLVKMKDLLDKQQFEVVLQAAANGKVVARETIKALRKNVTAKCYGGDVTRKRKLLDKQKEGKRRMKRMGNIDVPQELFPELMKTR